MQLLPHAVMAAVRRTKTPTGHIEEDGRLSVCQSRVPVEHAPSVAFMARSMGAHKICALICGSAHVLGQGETLSCGSGCVRPLAPGVRRGGALRQGVGRI